MNKYPVDPETLFVPDCDKTPGKFYWWFQDKSQFKLWEKMNSMTDEELKQEDELVRLLLKRYGNLYFYKPWTNQKPVAESDARILINHGNNNTGKSYAMGAKVGYEIAGWSPYCVVEPARFGTRKVWVFSANHNVQVTSAQNILFADGEGSVGLLPDLELFHPKNKFYEGGVVVRKDQGVQLKLVELPTVPPVFIEMKSADSANIATAGAAIDLIWLDEDPGENKFNEAIARVFRTGGKVFFTFLITTEGGWKKHYISNPDGGVFKTVQNAQKSDDEKLKEVAKNIEFYFYDISENEAITEEDKILYTLTTTEKERKLRYSPDGRWVTELDGDLVVPSFDRDVHIKPDLHKQYSEDHTLFCAWDMGTYSVLCGQYYDRQVNLLYSRTFWGKLLVESMDIFDADIKNLFPKLRDMFHILPHDANRTDKRQTGKSYTWYFDDKKWDNEVVWVVQENSIPTANELFLRNRNSKEPLIFIDPIEASETEEALLGSVLDDKGKVKRDKTYEHAMDCLLKLLTYFHDTLGLSYDRPDRYKYRDEEKRTDMLPGGIIL